MSAEKQVKAALGSAESVLFITHPESLHELTIDVLKYFVEDKVPGVYLTLNKPHEAVLESLRGHRVKTKDLYFIDCITAKVRRIPHKKQEKVWFADDPEDLDAKGKVREGVTQFLMSAEGEKFVVIDALRTLLLYNEAEKVSSFIKWLIDEAEGAGAKVIVLTRSAHDSELAVDVSYLFKEIVEL